MPRTESEKPKEVLSLSLRPQRFSELVGQASIVASLKKQHASGRKSRAFMFVGGTGTGKTTIARIIALGYQCNHGEFGEPCEDCIRKRDNFLISEINASEVRGVEAIGKVAETSRFAAIPPSASRVLILDEAQRMTAEAQNLLLKYVEDSPETTIWILCTTEPQKILATLRGRCTTYSLKPLTGGSKEILLKRGAKKIGLRASKLGALVEASDAVALTSPRGLLLALELYASGMGAIEAVASSDSGAEFDAFRVSRALVNGDTAHLIEVLREMLPEHSRWVRAGVAGYLRGTVLKSSSAAMKKQAAAAIIEVLAPAPMEDTLLRDWLIGVLYQACGRFERSR